MPNKPRYSFEKMNINKYQVRLQGFFITYTDKKDPKVVDEYLKSFGWESREQYLDYLIGGK